MKQPDLHHEGPLTVELVSGLMDKLKLASDEIAAIEFPADEYENNLLWAISKSKWLEILQYAGIRCAAIVTKLELDIEHRLDEDHKCIDITLCILRDYEAAKSKGFSET